MSDTLLLTIPGAEDEDGADYDLRVYEDAEDALVFERGPGTRRGACGEEAELVREILRAAAAERERIRLELLAEVEKWYESARRLKDPGDFGGACALRDFARRLEPKP